jgi:hypothetical protein
MFWLARSARTGCLIVLIATLGAAPAQEPNDDVDLPDGLEVQTRGPVHEAYAQPSDLKAEPGPVIAKEPPPAVPEEPPDYRPEGKDVAWIPGYWAWDVEREDYLWVSGTYRVAPEGRRWMPGHWVRADGGWRWVSGFWAPEEQAEVPYTPEPPEPLNNEPNLPAPNDDSTWVPGYWYYNNARFAWRPGYWAPQYQNRVWVSPRYTWSPSGYLYCDGYWDYPFEDRGLLFAPVYFNRPLWHTAGWHYRPWHTVGFGLFFDSCFWRYGSSHFYYGNYYSPFCHGLGYRPWFHHHHWDSSFAHHHWRHHHGDHDWHNHQRRLYADRRDGRAAGPPRDFAEQRRFERDGTLAGRKNAQAVASLKNAKGLNKNVNLVKNTPAQAEALKRQAARNQELVQFRNRADKGSDGAIKRGPTGRLTESASFKLPPRSDGDITVRPRDSVKDSPKSAASKEAGKLGSNIAPRKDDGPRNAPLVRPSTGNVGKKGLPPGGVNALAAPKPKLTSPRVTEAPPKGLVRPRDNGAPAPRVTNVVPPIDRKPAPAPAPRVIDAPKFSGRSSPSSGPKVTISPPSNVQPERRIESPPVRREVAAPKFTAPSAPKFSAPAAPKLSAPSAPRFSAPSAAPRPSSPAPRFSAPSPAPRFSAPSSAPRFNSAPRPSSAPRFNSAPRSAPSRSAPSPSRSAPARRGR